MTELIRPLADKPGGQRLSGRQRRISGCLETFADVGSVLVKVGLDMPLGLSWA